MCTHEEELPSSHPLVEIQEPETLAEASLRIQKNQRRNISGEAKVGAARATMLRLPDEVKLGLGCCKKMLREFERGA